MLNKKRDKKGWTPKYVFVVKEPSHFTRLLDRMKMLAIGGPALHVLIVKLPVLLGY